MPRRYPMVNIGYASTFLLVANINFVENPSYFSLFGNTTYHHVWIISVISLCFLIQTHLCVDKNSHPKNQSSVISRCSSPQIYPNMVSQTFSFVSKKSHFLGTILKEKMIHPPQVSSTENKIHPIPKDYPLKSS